MTFAPTMYIDVNLSLHNTQHGTVTQKRPTYPCVFFSCIPREKCLVPLERLVVLTTTWKRVFTAAVVGPSMAIKIWSLRSSSKVLSSYRYSEG